MRSVLLVLLSFLVLSDLYPEGAEFGGVSFRIAEQLPPEYIQSEIAAIYRLLTYFDGTPEFIVSKTQPSKEAADKILAQKMEAYQRYNALPAAYRSEHVSESFDLLNRFYSKREVNSRIRRNARFKKEEGEEAMFIAAVIVTYFNERSLRSKSLHYDNYYSVYSSSPLFSSLQFFDPDVILHLKPHDFQSYSWNKKDASRLAFSHNFTLMNVLIEYAPAFDSFPDHVLNLLGSQRNDFEKYAEGIQGQREVLRQMDAARDAYVANMRQLYAEARFTEFLVLLRFYESLYPASLSILSHQFDANSLLFDTLVRHEGLITSLSHALQDPNYAEDDLKPLGRHMYHIHTD